MTQKKDDKTSAKKTKSRKKSVKESPKPQTKAKILLLTHQKQKRDKALHSSPPIKTLTRENIQALYLNWLRQEGYVPELSGDIYVNFKYEGFSYWLTVYEKDQTYFRLGTYRCWDIEPHEPLDCITAAINHANTSTKVAKAFINEKNQVRYCVELFVPKVEDFQFVVRRSLLAICHLITVFQEKAKELIKEKVPTPST